MSMYWLVENSLRKFAELPSGGDTSYPGFTEDLLRIGGRVTAADVTAAT